MIKTDNWYNHYPFEWLSYITQQFSGIYDSGISMKYLQKKK